MARTAEGHEASPFIEERGGRRVEAGVQRGTCRGDGEPQATGRKAKEQAINGSGKGLKKETKEGEGAIPSLKK